MVHLSTGEWFHFKVAGCRLLVIWLHSGYRITDYLVTGLSFDSPLISPNPMRSVVYVRMPHT